MWGSSLHGVIGQPSMQHPRTRSQQGGNEEIIRLGSESRKTARSEKKKTSGKNYMRSIGSGEKIWEHLVVFSVVWL